MEKQLLVTESQSGYKLSEHIKVAPAWPPLIPAHKLLHSALFLTEPQTHHETFYPPIFDLHLCYELFNFHQSFLFQSNAFLI